MKRFLSFIIIVIILLTGVNKFLSIGVNTRGKIDFDQENEGIINYANQVSKSAINNVNQEVSSSQTSFKGYLTAESAILVNTNDGDILFDKDSKERIYPASTTKILTALLAIENCNLNEKVTVGREVYIPPDDSSVAGIRYGETLTMEQLLNALLIPSGDDAAYTIAVYVARKVSGNEDLSINEAVQYFCELMNKRAKELGAQDSNFANPDGYPNPNHYTTAYDISLIAREALKYKTFRDIVDTQTYRLPDIKVVDKNGISHKKQRILINTDKLILENDDNYFKYATGVKTGHTTEAGYCLVSAAEDNGKSVLAVVMHSSEENVWSDSKDLLEYGIEK